MLWTVKHLLLLLQILVPSQICPLTLTTLQGRPRLIWNLPVQEKKLTLLQHQGLEVFWESMRHLYKMMPFYHPAPTALRGRQLLPKPTFQILQVKPLSPINLLVKKQVSWDTTAQV